MSVDNLTLDEFISFLENEEMSTDGPVMLSRATMRRVIEHLDYLGWIEARNAEIEEGTN